MLRRIVLALMLSVMAASASALEYTDVYWTDGEPGWGAFLVQSNTFQFLAFFIYGSDGTPTWYTADLSLDSVSGNYNGGLYASTGTYFAAPWIPGQQHTVQVGTASFQPIDIYHATLTYALTGGPTVTKTIQRLTLTPYVLSGSYSGSLVGAITGCTNPANNTTLKARYNLTVTQAADSAASLQFTFVDTTYTGMVCTLAGPLAHMGRLYEMPGAQYTCTGGPGFSPGTPSTATIGSFHPTGQGIEGHWTATTSDGCSQAIRFASVLY